MTRMIKRIIQDQRGQAFPIVLAFFALGTLAIVPSLGHATSTLNLTRITTSNVEMVYAAEAGVENAVWSVVRGGVPPTQIPESVNGASVSIQAENKGTYTLVFGEFIEPNQPRQYLQVSSNIEQEGGLYKYTVTVTLQPEASSRIHLTEVGVKLPEGFSYSSGSSASFPDNLSTEDPEEVDDFLRWEFDSPYPDVSQQDPVATQSFYIAGAGNLGSNYSWVVANRSDVGEVGELFGSLYVITATATKTGSATVSIVAIMMIVDGQAKIISWHRSR